jgi:hypothetical protein
MSQAIETSITEPTLNRTQREVRPRRPITVRARLEGESRFYGLTLGAAWARAHWPQKLLASLSDAELLAFHTAAAVAVVALKASEAHLTA